MIKKIKRIIVFISCPDDVKKEKGMVEKVCEEISLIYKRVNVEVKAVEWRKDFIPLITGERPQVQINREIENSSYV